jgi:hypothetical protein
MASPRKRFVQNFTSRLIRGNQPHPDLQTSAARARDTAYRRALQDVTAAGGSSAAEAQTALADVAPAGSD